jgi:hypothetical protein
MIKSLVRMAQHRALVDGLIHLPQHVFGFPSEGDVPDDADRSDEHLFFEFAQSPVRPRRSDFPVGDDRRYHVPRPRRAAPLPAPEPDFQVLRLPVHAATFIEHLGRVPRTGPVLVVDRQQVLPADVGNVLLEQEGAEVLADEVFGLVSEKLHRLVDEGEYAFGTQLVDDIRQGLDEILVALGSVPELHREAAPDAPKPVDVGTQVLRPVRAGHQVVDDSLAQGTVQGIDIVSHGDAGYDRITLGYRRSSAVGQLDRGDDKIEGRRDKRRKRFGDAGGAAGIHRFGGILQRRLDGLYFAFLWKNEKHADKGDSGHGYSIGVFPLLLKTQRTGPRWCRHR